jgi:hypothetical protein
MYKLRDPADQLEHDVHIDELCRYNIGLTDGPVDVISMDEALAEMLSGYSCCCRSSVSRQGQVQVGRP